MLRIARKNHICSICETLIREGEEYIDRTTSIYRGHKISIHLRIHRFCAKPSVDILRDALRKHGVDA